MSRTAGTGEARTGGEPRLLFKVVDTDIERTVRFNRRSSLSENGMIIEASPSSLVFSYEPKPSDPGHCPTHVY